MVESGDPQFEAVVKTIGRISSALESAQGGKVPATLVECIECLS